MTYGRITTPRFYMNNITWLASKGASRDDTFALNAGAGFNSLNAGFTKYQLFNDNPIDYVTFDTGAGTKTASIKIDLGQAGIECDFVSILNHNLNKAAGSIRVAHHTSAITTVGGGTETTGNGTELNAAIGGGTVIEPAADGDTLYTFTGSTDRYWVIEFSDIATWSATDLQVGEIVLGKYWTASLSPDMGTPKGTGFGGVNVRYSLGGKAFGFASHTGAPSGAYCPFRDIDEITRVGGRESYSFSYRFLADTTIYPSDRSAITASDNFLADVATKASMSLLPFIFTCDSSSSPSTAGDYMFARFDQPSLETSNDAWQVVSFSARVVQEF